MEPPVAPFSTSGFLYRAAVIEFFPVVLLHSDPWHTPIPPHFHPITHCTILDSSWQGWKVFQYNHLSVMLYFQCAILTAASQFKKKNPFKSPNTHTVEIISTSTIKA